MKKTKAILAALALAIGGLVWSIQPSSARVAKWVIGGGPHAGQCVSDASFFRNGHPNHGEFRDFLCTND